MEFAVRVRRISHRRQQGWSVLEDNVPHPGWSQAPTSSKDAHPQDPTGVPRIRNSLLFQEYHRVIGVVLLKGPTVGLFLMSEVRMLMHMQRNGYEPPVRCTGVPHS